VVVEHAFSVESATFYFSVYKILWYWTQIGQFSIGHMYVDTYTYNY